MWRKVCMCVYVWVRVWGCYDFNYNKADTFGF